MGIFLQGLHQRMKSWLQRKLLDFKHDMRKINKAKLKHLEEKKQEFKEQLVGLHYSMEDQKTKYVKVQNNMYEV
jgi:hypothetical protein